MNFLPIELQLIIASYLSPLELLRLSTINKGFSYLSTDEQLWRQHVYRQFGSNADKLTDSWLTTYKIYFKFRRPYIVAHDSIQDGYRILASYSSKKDALASLVSYYLADLARYYDPIKRLRYTFEINVLEHFPQSLIDAMVHRKLHEHELKQQFVDYVTTLLLTHAYNSGYSVSIRIEDDDIYWIIFDDIKYNIEDKSIWPSDSVLQWPDVTNY